MGPAGRVAIPPENQVVLNFKDHEPPKVMTQPGHGPWNDSGGGPGELRAGDFSMSSTCLLLGAEGQEGAGSSRSPAGQCCSARLPLGSASRAPDHPFPQPPLLLVPQSLSFPSLPLPPSCWASQHCKCLLVVGCSAQGCSVMRAMRTWGRAWIGGIPLNSSSRYPVVHGVYE